MYGTSADGSPPRAVGANGEGYAAVAAGGDEGFGGVQGGVAEVAASCIAAAAAVGTMGAEAGVAIGAREVFLEVRHVCGSPCVSGGEG